MKRKWFRYCRYLALVLLITLAGILYCLALPRAGSEPLPRADSPDTASVSEAETAASKAAVPEETTPQECYVYICGEVNKPGVYVLAEGQRIFEAVELAGGFTGEAAPEALNLAMPIADGMKIDIPDKERAAAMPETVFISGPGSVQSDKVNINTATREQLMTLNGIGTARADAIIAYRQENGAFSAIEDIMQVSGIKEAAFAKIKDHITVR